GTDRRRVTKVESNRGPTQTCFERRLVNPLKHLSQWFFLVGHQGGKQSDAHGHPPAWITFELPRAIGNELLNAHAMINIADIDRAIFSNRHVVAPIDLPIIIAEATPFADDFAGAIDVTKLAKICRRGLQLAAV